MTTDVDATEQPPGPSSAPTVVSPTTGEPVKLFSRQWFSGVLLRYSMVIVVLLVIAYFSYRSARFSTSRVQRSVADHPHALWIPSLRASFPIFPGAFPCLSHVFPMSFPGLFSPHAADLFHHGAWFL